MVTTLDAQQLKAWILQLPERFAASLEELNALDARAGDGDHGATMLRAARAAAEAAAGANAADAATLLTAAGSAFRRAAGGAAGPLFSSILTELGKAATPDGLTADGLATGLRNAAIAVARLGHAEPGDRTMLDALAPAAEAAAGADTLEAALRDAATAAAEGAAATASMLARKGRARYVNAGDVGVPDAGAHSVALVLDALRAAQEPR